MFQKDSRKPLNILITEAYTDANVGSAALMENTLKLLRKRFPEAHLRVLAIYPEAFSGMDGVEKSEADPFDYPYKRSKIEKLKWMGKTLFWMGLIWMQAHKRLRRFHFQSSKFEAYLWADWVVSIHAERIKEAFYVDPLYTLFCFRIAHVLGKKVILFPCTLGPYGFGTQALVNTWLRDVDLIFTRDALSCKLARQTKGLDLEKVVECPDVAVIQDYLPREEALKLIGCSPQDRLVGISVMRWRYIKGQVSAYSCYQSYVAEMAKVIDALVRDRGVKVVLYPTNYAIRGCTTEDREAIRDIFQAATEKEGIVCMKEFLNPAQLKGALACSEVNITTRMHACIFSTGAGVPTISINYLYKLREYMASLGLAEYSVDIENFNAEWTLATFEKIWTRRCEIRQQIESHMAAKRDILEQKMDLLLQ